MKAREELIVGFVGFGNMAQAIAEGLIRSGALRAQQICACAKRYEKLCTVTQPKGMYPCRTVQEVAERSDLVIVAVKPYRIETVLESVRGMLSNKIIVSVAAGWQNTEWERFMPGTHHISTMPNTPVRVCDGVILLEQEHTLTQEEYSLVEELLSFISLVQPIESRLFDIAGTVAGCGPAFVSMFIEALGDAGVKYGMTREMAYRLAGKMVSGTGRMLVESGEHPGVLKDAVCSPGGTTIRGVIELERSGLRSAVINAIDAIEQR